MNQINKVSIGDMVFCRGRLCFVEKIVRGVAIRLSTSGFDYLQINGIPIVYFKPTPLIADKCRNHQENLYKIHNHPKMREISHCLDTNKVENKLENLWTEMCLSIGDDSKSYEARSRYDLFVKDVMNCIEEIAELKEKSVYQGVQLFK